MNIRKKLLIILLIVLGIELTFIGFQFLKPTQTTDVTKTSASSRTSEKETATTADSSETNADPWIESSEEISFPILMYHSLAESEGNSLKIPPAEFREHMQWLKEHDYYTLTPEEAYRVLTENKKPAEKIVWITFDDGYLNNYEDGFPILKELDLNATINYIVDRQGASTYIDVPQMKEMKDSGLVHIESHTMNHLEVDKLAEADLAYELSESKAFFDNTLNQETLLLCYPAGRYNETSKTAAADAGYKMAVTTEPGYARASDGLFALKRVRISPGYDGEGFGQLITAYQ
ncbi:polysaccharide deacetylase family protein [Vagococcus acidifermentans]